MSHKLNESIRSAPATDTRRKPDLPDFLKTPRARRASAFLPSFSKKDEQSVSENSAETFDRKSIATAYDAFEQQSSGNSIARPIPSSRQRAAEISSPSIEKGEENEFMSDTSGYRRRRRKSLGPDSHDELHSNEKLNKSKQQPSDEALEFMSSNYILNTLKPKIIIFVNH